MSTKTLCITGMHRSGTSLTASWLQKCGVQIGYGKLIGASVGNPKGHFEDKEFVELHSKIIKNCLPGSKGWIVTQDRNLKIEGEDELAAKEIINLRNQKYDLWGWKDPRTVLFLEEWKKTVPDIKYIFVWRSANDVVRSLLSRSTKSKHPTDLISHFDAYKAWNFYNTSILNFIERNSEKCILISMDCLIKNSRDIYNRLKEKWNLDIKYYPMNQILDDRLISQRQWHLKDVIYQNALKVKKIEKRLFELSLK